MEQSTSPKTDAPEHGGNEAKRQASLPAYLRSLLQIQVTLSVTLVSKPQPIERILELGPGSILPFDKACADPLSVEVGGQEIAEGEAVKVGDKFGVRLTSLRLPSERLEPVRSRKNTASPADAPPDGQ